MIKGCVGKGAYAKVYVAKRISNNKLYAIKVYSKDYLTKPHRIVNVQNEITIGSQIRHQNIVKLYYMNETNDTVNLIMEYGGKTSIEKLIEKMPDRKIPEGIAAKIFYNCLLGLSFLHGQQIYHRDIKLGNVLVMEDFSAKFIDFGFSVKGNGSLLNTYCGTPCYMSPEILMKKPYNAVCADMWAMGVLLYRMVTGEQPFKGKGSELRNQILMINYEIPSYVSANLRNIIDNIFKQNATDRPSCDELLTSPWFAILEI